MPRRSWLAGGFLLFGCADPGVTDARETAASSTVTTALAATSNTAATCEISARDFEVIAQHPHDPTAFTQGLLFHDGFLYESTGRYGQSAVRKVELKTGRVVQQARLPGSFFGEGLALSNGHFVQLTWRSGTGFRYARDTLEEVGRFRYGTEGWGLTTDGDRLIMSDGSHVLTFLSGDGAERLGQIEVTDGGRPVRHLNELEWIDGHVFANIWYSGLVVRIDPTTGEVVDRYDLTRLYECAAPPGDDGVLNGIAYDRNTGRIWVTGKLWSRLFEVRLRGVR